MEIVSYDYVMSKVKERGYVEDNADLDYNTMTAVIGTLRKEILNL